MPPQEQSPLVTADYGLRDAVIQTNRLLRVLIDELRTANGYLFDISNSKILSEEASGDATTKPFAKVSV